MGKIYIHCKQKNKNQENDNNGIGMLIVMHALDHPNGTHTFYNPNTDVVVISSSTNWSDFKP